MVVVVVVAAVVLVSVAVEVGLLVIRVIVDVEVVVSELVELFTTKSKEQVSTDADGSASHNAGRNGFFTPISAYDRRQA